MEDRTMIHTAICKPSGTLRPLTVFSLTGKRLGLSTFAVLLGVLLLLPVQAIAVTPSDLDIITTAANFDGQSDPDDDSRISISDGRVSNIKDGTWVRYDNFDFGAGADSVDVGVGSPNGAQPGSIEVRIGSPTGTLLGTVDVETTGRYYWYKTYSAPLQLVSGVHNLYLVFVSRESLVDAEFELAYFRINAYTEPELDTDTDKFISALDYDEQSDPDNNGRIRDRDYYISHIQDGTWIRYADFNFGQGVESIDVLAASFVEDPGSIEIRIGSTTGTLLGTVDVTTTGSWTTWQTFSSPLASVSGIHDLYLVFVDGDTNVQSFVINSLSTPLTGPASDTVSQALDYDEQSDPDNPNNYDATDLSLLAGQWLSPRAGLYHGRTVPPGLDADSEVNLEDLAVLARGWLRGNSPIQDQEYYIGQIQDGDWILYADFDFGSGIKDIDVLAAAANTANPGSIEVRLGSVTGTLLGTVDVTTTGDWTAWQLFNAPLASVSGVHDLYLVFVGGDFNVQSFIINNANLGAVVQALDYDEQSDPGNDGRIRDRGYYISHLQNDTWVRFENFSIPGGAKSIDVSASSNRDGGILEVRAASLRPGVTNGGITTPTHISILEHETTLIARVQVPNTGGWTAFQTFSAPIRGMPPGLYDLYFVFRSDGDYNMESFTINRAETHISGRVIDYTNTGLSGVTVTSQVTGRETVTDSNGVYHFDFDKFELAVLGVDLVRDHMEIKDTLVFSKEGYNDRNEYVRRYPESINALMHHLKDHEKLRFSTAQYPALAEVYSESGFMGDKITFTEVGHYSGSAIAAMGIAPEDIMGVRVAPGYRVRFIAQNSMPYLKPEDDDCFIDDGPRILGSIQSLYVEEIPEEVRNRHRPRIFLAMHGLNNLALSEEDDNWPYVQEHLDGFFWNTSFIGWDSMANLVGNSQTRIAIDENGGRRLVGSYGNSISNFSSSRNIQPPMYYEGVHYYRRNLENASLTEKFTQEGRELAQYDPLPPGEEWQKINRIMMGFQPRPFDEVDDTGLAEIEFSPFIDTFHHGDGLFIEAPYYFGVAGSNYRTFVGAVNLTHQDRPNKTFTWFMSKVGRLDDPEENASWFQALKNRYYLYEDAGIFTQDDVIALVFYWPSGQEEESIPATPELNPDGTAATTITGIARWLLQQ